MKKGELKLTKNLKFDASSKWTHLTPVQMADGASVGESSLGSLYSEDGTARIPSTYQQMTPDGDVAALNTQFDIQAAIGTFGIDLKSTTNTTAFDQLTEEYTREVQAFLVALQQCMALRDKYQILSSQCSIDNPINNIEQWKSYPPPLAKFWHYEDEFGSTDYYYDENRQPHYSGENFDINEYLSLIVDPMESGQAKKYTGLIVGKSHALEVQGFKHPDLPNFHEFLQDLTSVIDTSTNKTGIMLSIRRLEYLKSKFEEYVLLNEHQETLRTKLNPHRDFYNVRKVDNNITLSMSMTKKHLLNIINNKLKCESDRIVYDQSGIRLTLAQLFAPFVSEGTNRLNIDDLFEFGLIDRSFGSNNILEYEIMDHGTIERNETLARIEKTFLEIDNYIEGEYLSTILKEVICDYEKSKYQLGELGISLNLERQFQSWDYMSNWIVKNRLVSHNIKWLIRIPRSYSILRAQSKVHNFQEYLNLIFKPLFEVSMNPRENINLHFFLSKISAFDLLSKDSYRRDQSLFDVLKLRSPKKWNDLENPPYCYYLYYIFINLCNLNSFRKSRNLPIFNLRPHVASIADKSGLGIITESLSTCFLLSKNIINGEKLENYPVLQYLYYLKQIGITMSPLCWNKTLQFLNDDDFHVGNEESNAAYEKNPTIEFFKLGMRVSLSTNKPLFSSLTREPLIEEYSISGSIHKLSSVDLCELSRNSVLISGFNGASKRHWIGIEYKSEGDPIDYEEIDDFVVQRTNIPNMRLDYRHDSVKLEHEFINKFKK